MIDIIKCNLSFVTIHIVGNKNKDENIVFSSSLVDLAKASLRMSLMQYFFAPFKSNEYFRFCHDSNINLNETYIYCSKIFDNPENLYKQSVHLAKHLYNQSTHPKIKGGEFYVVYFKDCIIDGDTVDAVGLFKSENKDTFLKVLRQNGNFNLESEKGINIKKLDKGCLIFNKEKENGYVVAVVDNTNKGVEAQYWIDDFLHVRPRKDEYSNTQNIMSMAKSFVTKELPKEYEMSKADQIELLNKSLDFFKSKETFNLNDFANEVIAQPEVIKKFQQYKQEYEETNDIAIDNQFAISDAARKKQQRSYKRVIHLDKKIQIIIDGNSDNVEHGKDARGNYYKVYYNEEE